MESLRKGSYADVEFSKNTRDTPTSSIFLLSADGVTLLVGVTTARVKQSSLGHEICFVMCSSLQRGLRSATLSAVAYTDDGSNWSLGIFLGADVETSGNIKVHLGTWLPNEEDGVSLPFFYKTKHDEDLSSNVKVQSVNVGGKVSCVFLTQVSGRRSGGRDLASGILNAADLCLQCSKVAPDKLLHFSRSLCQWPKGSLLLKGKSFTSGRPGTLNGWGSLQVFLFGTASTMMVVSGRPSSKKHQYTSQTTCCCQ